MTISFYAEKQLCAERQGRSIAHNVLSRNSWKASSSTPVRLQRWCPFAQRHCLMKSRGQATDVVEIVQLLMFRVRLALNDDHFRSSGLFEQSFENANGIVRANIDSSSHAIRDAVQLVGLDHIDEQKVKLVRPRCLPVHDLDWVLLFVVQWEVLRRTKSTGNVLIQ